MSQWQFSTRHFFFFFGCVGSSLLWVGSFSSCAEWGLLCSCNAQASHCSEFSCCETQDLGTWASVAVACRPYSKHVSVVVTHQLSCSMACGFLLIQGSNLCPLHWQVWSLIHSATSKVLTKQLLTTLWLFVFKSSWLSSLEYSFVFTPNLCLLNCKS